MEIFTCMRGLEEQGNSRSGVRGMTVRSLLCLNGGVGVRAVEPCNDTRLCLNALACVSRNGVAMSMHDGSSDLTSGCDKNKNSLHS